MNSKPNSYVDIVSLANCTVYFPPGRQLKLGQLWQKQTVIMVFLRHFACIACRAHASQVWQEREKYEKSGAKLVFIGNGHPDFVSKFVEDLGLGEAMVLTDPSLESFRAAGMKRGFFQVIQPKSLTGALQLAKQGHRQTAHSSEAGTHWQMGGVLAINSKSKILYHYRSEFVGDIPNEPYIEIIQKDEEKSVS